MAKTHTTNLCTLVKEGSPHHLLHALRESTFTQSHLDEAAHLACYHGNPQCLSLLLASGADINSLNDHGECMLLQAVHSENVETVRVLLEAGYDVLGCEDPVLHFGILTSKACNMVDILLSAGADTERRNQDTDTPLILAANLGAYDVIVLLITAGCNLDALGYEDNTALHRATEHGDLNIVRLLLENGASPNTENISGDTPLLVACERGHTPIARALVEHGGHATHVNKSGRTAAHCGAVCGDWELAEVLLGSGALMATRDNAGNTPLITAACCHNQDYALSLLQNTPTMQGEGDGTALDVNGQGEGGRTALHWAASHGLLDLISALIEIPSISLHTRDDIGDSPVLLATKSMQFEAVQLLMPAETKVNVQGERGLTLLHWSVIHGELNIVKQLLACPSLDLEVKDVTGNTPLLLAASLQRYTEMGLLLTHGSEVKVQGASKRTALHWASQRGNVEMVRRLIECHSPLDVLDKDHNSPLLLAAKHGQEASAGELVSAGATLDTPDSESRMALHYMALKGMVEAAREVIHRGGQTDGGDHTNSTPLVLAAEKGHADLVQLLLGHSDVNAVSASGKTALWHCASNSLQKCVDLLLDAGAQPDIGEGSALIQASRLGNMLITQSLLAKGAQVNRTDSQGRTALMWASLGGHLDIVKLLHATGADVRATDKASDTALTLAAWHTQDAVLEYIAPHSDLAHCEGEEGMDALHLAIARDSLNCVNVLLQAGANINTQDQVGNTALHTAAMHTSGTAILMFLLESGQGFDMDAKGGKGRTVLHWCVGDPESVALLLHYGPNLNLLDSNGASPLLLAIAHEQPRSARLLIEAGCDIHMVHQDERRPIHHAAIYGDEATVQLLLERGVSVDCPTPDGRSPLLLAAIEGHIAVVSILLRHHCQVNTVYFSAVTALSVAADQRHYEVVKALIAAGAEPDLIGSQKLTPLTSCVVNNDPLGTVLLLQAGASLEPTNNKHPLQIAAIKGLSDMILLLLSVMCDVNYMRSLLKGGSLYMYIEDPALLALMQSLSNTPRTLKMLCRHVIRTNLQRPLLTTIETMLIPKALRQYLAMADLDMFLD